MDDLELYLAMKCAVCSQQSVKSCSGCKKVYYCCYKHQKVDWKRHKDICAPYSVSTNDGINVLILRRNVPPGAIIMDEAPIFHVPESNGIRVNSVCVVCGLHMISSTINRCSVCTWPVCGFDCESHPIHKDNECKIFTAGKFEYEPNMFGEMPNIIAQTRAMTFKTIFPIIWNDMKDLLTGTPRFSDDWQLANAGEYRRFVKNILPHSNERERKLAIEDALTLRKLIVRRAFYINAQDSLDSKELARTGKWRAGFYVYKKASLAKHSCVPNCVWNISNFPDFKIRLRAAYQLTKGQVLTVNHLENHAESQKGTVERRIGHYFRFGHVCMCERCIDPTELGTYISAIVCKNCRGSDTKDTIVSENSGYLLPDNNRKAIGIKGNVPWRCNACENVVQLSKIYPKIEEITKALEANDGKSIDYSASNAENIARSLIAQYRDTILHPNHWLIQKATLILIDNAYHAICSKPKNTDKDVDDLLAHCRYMLKILNKLHPGLSVLKSKVTLSLTGTVAAQMECVTSKMKNESELSDHMKNYTVELIRLKKELLEFYKDDFPLERGREKSEFGVMVEKDVEELTGILEMVDEIQQMPD